MKEICLTKGYVALVDDEDYPWLDSIKWRVRITPKTNYAHNEKESFMHIKILKYYNLYIIGLETDHRNRNGLDNQKENLRIATKSQNMANRSIHINNTSGFRGVYWDSKNLLWRVQLRVNGKIIPLGSYVNKNHAARMYNYYAKLYFGEFASLNDVPD